VSKIQIYIDAYKKMAIFYLEKSSAIFVIFDLGTFNG